MTKVSTGVHHGYHEIWTHKLVALYKGTINGGEGIKVDLSS